MRVDFFFIFYLLSSRRGTNFDITIQTLEREKKTEEAANISSVLRGFSLTFADLYMCFDGIFVIFKNYLRLYFMQK